MNLRYLVLAFAAVPLLSSVVGCQQSKEVGKSSKQLFRGEVGAVVQQSPQQVASAVEAAIADLKLVHHRHHVRPHRARRHEQLLGDASRRETRSDEIELSGVASFASHANEVAGRFATAAPFSRVQADDGLSAQIVEACTGGAPASNVQALCGTTAGGVSVTSADQAIRSDDSRATTAGAGTSVHVTGFDVPQSTQATLSSFTIVHEGARGGGGSTNPTVQLEYQFDASCSGAWTAAGATFTLTSTSDATTTRTVSAGAPYAISQIESLCVRARVTVADRSLLTDALSITVTYPGATTTYDLNTEFGWTGLAVGGCGRSSSRSAIRVMVLRTRCVDFGVCTRT